MTNEEWLTQAKQDEDKLMELIKKFHPINRSHDGVPAEARQDLVVSAERANQVAREAITENYNSPFNPVLVFQNALKEGEYTIAINILNETWFGVPESASYAWSQTGFKECVALLEEFVEKKGEV